MGTFNFVNNTDGLPLSSGIADGVLMYPAVTGFDWSVLFTNSDGLPAELHLTGMALGFADGNLPWQGEVTGMRYVVGDTVWDFDFSSVSMAAVQFSSFIQNDDLEGLFAKMMQGDDLVTGSADGDNLPGHAGNDTIYGYDGNDLINGGAGDDALIGGAGSDTASYEDASAAVLVSLALTAAQDTGSAGIDTLSEIENLIGSAYNDQLTGDGANNVLEGGLGNDQLNGGGGGADVASYAGASGAVQVNLASGAVSGAAGTDTLMSIEGAAGSAFNDTLIGSSGSNQLSGLDGADSLSGLDGADILDGGAGNDVLNGGVGVDQLFGGAGDDTYYVDTSGDLVIENGGEGTDRIFSSVSFVIAANVEHLTLTGTGNTTVFGNELANTLFGNSGNNVINGGLGADTMLGGAGDDIFYIDNAGDAASEVVGGGTDHVYSSVSHVLWANVEKLTLTGTNAINGGGNDLNNTLFGNAGNNVINGGLGADTMLGGAGDDIFYIDNAGDVASEAAGGGTDHVYSSLSHVLWSNVEKLTLTGTNAINAGGNELNNTIFGNAGNNIINGGLGADTMLGGAGDDTFYIDNVGDAASEAAGGGYDQVYSSVTHALWTNIEKLTLTGTNAINGTGNDANNTIYGNSGNNQINGAGGADAMNGGAGDDTYYVDDAGDRAYESVGGGTDRVFSSVSFTLGVNVENLTLTGSAAANGTGNASNNVIVGNSGANSIAGGLGDDALIGGGGADSFVFNTALGAGNVDQLVDFSVTDDTAVLSQSVFTAFGLPGTLNAASFVTGTGAGDADDRIIYDSATGNVYYDADGNGAGTATLFALVSAGTGLTSSDFLIVA